MKLTLATLVAAAAVILALPAFTADAPSLAPITYAALPSFTIGGTVTACDYITYDADGGRLFVSNRSRIVVLDASTGKQLGEVDKLAGVHGIAIATAAGKGFITEGTTNSVAVFDLKTYATLSEIKVGKGPDYITYDPFTKCVLVADHSGGDISIIDPMKTDAAPTSITVGGTLEAVACDGVGQAYVNEEDKDQVAAIDLRAMKVTQQFALPTGTGPTGLAMDTTKRRLYVGGGASGNLIVLDADSGKVLGTDKAGKGIDGTGFDASTGTVFVPCGGGTGTMVIYPNADPANLAAGKQTVATTARAKCVAVDTATHRAFSPCVLPADAAGNKPFGVFVVGPQPAATPAPATTTPTPAPAQP